MRRGSRFALAAAGVVRGPVRAGCGPAHTRNRKRHGRERTHGLVTLTWGNASGIDRAEGLVVIKASGVQCETMTAADMVVVDLDGNVAAGDRRTSTDTPTHLADPAGAVEHAVTLEEVARIAVLTTVIEPAAAPLDAAVRQKHFERKHGPQAYYGQP